jgi:hypothetical protein
VSKPPSISTCAPANATHPTDRLLMRFGELIDGEDMAVVTEALVNMLLNIAVNAARTEKEARNIYGGMLRQIARIESRVPQAFAAAEAYRRRGGDA